MEFLRDALEGGFGVPVQGVQDGDGEVKTDRKNVYQRAWRKANAEVMKQFITKWIGYLIKAVKALGAGVERTGPGAWTIEGVGTKGFSTPAGDVLLFEKHGPHFYEFHWLRSISLPRALIRFTRDAFREMYEIGRAHV